MSSVQSNKNGHTPKCTNGDVKKSLGMIVIPDDDVGYSLNSFSLPKHYEDYVNNVLIPYGLIQDRIERMAKDFVDSCPEGERYTALCVLKGGFRFLSDLIDKITSITRKSGFTVPIHMDFIRLKSYEDDSSTGTVQIIGGDDLSTLKGQNVLVVEDIVDTGRTMTKLLAVLNKYEPKSIQVFSLIVKRTPLSIGYLPDYAGFQVPNSFIVGYALDYNEHFRDLNHICIINDSGKKHFSKRIMDSGKRQSECADNVDNAQ